MCEITSSTSRQHHIDYTPEKCCGHCSSLRVYGIHFSREWISGTSTAVQNMCITSVKD